MVAAASFQPGANDFVLACQDLKDSGEGEGQVYDRILRIRMQARRCIWGCSHLTG